MIDQPMVFPNGKSFKFHSFSLYVTTLHHRGTKSSMSSVPRNLFRRRFWGFSITERTGRHESMSASRSVANEAWTVSLQMDIATIPTPKRGIQQDSGCKSNMWSKQHLTKPYSPCQLPWKKSLYVLYDLYAVCIVQTQNSTTEWHNYLCCTGVKNLEPAIVRDEATHHEENSVNILVTFTESNPDLAWMYPCTSFANFLLPKSRFPKHPVQEQLGPPYLRDVTQYRWSDPVAAFPFCQVSAEHGHTIGWNHTDPCTRIHAPSLAITPWQPEFRDKKIRVPKQEKYLSAVWPKPENKQFQLCTVLWVSTLFRIDQALPETIQQAAWRSNEPRNDLLSHAIMQ